MKMATAINTDFNETDKVAILPNIIKDTMNSNNPTILDKYTKKQYPLER